MCDLGYIIKDHMKLLMKLFGSDLADFGLQHSPNVTKCLNTAVMTMFSFLGQPGMDHANFCDVTVVENRYKKYGDKSIQNMDVFSRNILKSSPTTRKLYYVMFTSAELPHVDGEKQQVSFPGHVFVFDKSYNKDTKQPKFNMYQSYINQYDLEGAIRKNNNSLEISYKDMEYIVNSMIYFFHNGIWDVNVSKFWKKLTYTDAAEYENHIITGNILFCCRIVNVKSCTSTLLRLLADKKIQEDTLSAAEKNELETLVKKLTDTVHRPAYHM